MTINVYKPSRVTAALGVSFAAVALTIALAGAWLIAPAAGEQPRLAYTASIR
jgi:hypothetical protein